MKKIRQNDNGQKKA
ncbi:hypothetical protein CP8484711_0939A, partial [Chlamydia psittaci 84-8471/1]